MNQFVQRVANYIANEVLIKGLANSKTFQRFALKTDHTLSTMKKTGTEKLETSFEEMTSRASEAVASGNSKAAAGSPGGPPLPPPRGFGGFIRAFAREVQSDFGGGGKA